jgi:hypothetical protein
MIEFEYEITRQRVVAEEVPGHMEGLPKPLLPMPLRALRPFINLFFVSMVYTYTRSELDPSIEIVTLKAKGYLFLVK